MFAYVWEYLSSGKTIGTVHQERETEGEVRSNRDVPKPVTSLVSSIDVNETPVIHQVVRIPRAFRVDLFNIWLMLWSTKELYLHDWKIAARRLNHDDCGVNRPALYVKEVHKNPSDEPAERLITPVTPYITTPTLQWVREREGRQAGRCWLHANKNIKNDKYKECIKKTRGKRKGRRLEELNSIRRLLKR